MKLLSVEALGGSLYRATFDIGVHDVEVTDHQGIQGASGHSFLEMLNQPFADWDEKRARADQVSLLIRIALALGSEGSLTFYTT